MVGCGGQSWAIPLRNSRWTKGSKERNVGLTKKEVMLIEKHNWIVSLSEITGQDGRSGKERRKL